MAVYQHDYARGPDGPRVATMANWAGALVSLALVAGVSVWGYQLLQRDVTGIPVVSASEGPIRVAPEDPGGLAANHQGLAVNDVAGTGNTTPPADRLVLAPRPVPLTEEDAPLAQLSATETNSALVASSKGLADPTEEPAPDVTAAAELSPEEAALQALVQQIAADVKPLEELPDAPSASVDAQAETTSPLITPARFEGPGLARSLRPVLRPANLRPAVVAATEPAVARDIDAASLPVGTSLVQLGAYDSVAVAQTEWDRIQSRFTAYFDGKQRVVQQAASGGRTFYRLRVAGFDDLSAARRFCAALLAERAECIPVVTR